MQLFSIHNTFAFIDIHRSSTSSATQYLRDDVRIEIHVPHMQPSFRGFSRLHFAHSIQTRLRKRVQE